jgi:hypothetical protein
MEEKLWGSQGSGGRGLAEASWMVLTACKDKMLLRKRPSFKSRLVSIRRNKLRLGAHACELKIWMQKVDGIIFPTLKVGIFEKMRQLD